MSGRKWRDMLMVVLLVVLAIGVLRRPRGRVHAQAATTNTVPGKGKTSAAPLGLLGFYLNTGFSLQPDSRFAYTNQSKMLTTDTAHSMWSLINLTARNHFQWYQSDDLGKTWKKVSKNGTKSDLLVTPEQIGVVHYQASFQYYTLTSAFMPTYYSNVVSVTTLSDPIEAAYLAVTSDNDYLYNNQSVAATTYVHGTPTPENATGDITWTSSDPDLATVDAKTGKVTANVKAVAGKVTITGTLKNYATADVAASVTVTVGGGLADQTVDEHQPATFHVMGSGQQPPDSVTWHKVVGNQDTVVATNRELTYTTPATTMADNGAKYYAVVTVTVTDDKDKPQTQTLTTNQAQLTVNPDTAPQVQILSQLKNKTALAVHAQETQDVDGQATSQSTQLNGPGGPTTAQPAAEADTDHSLVNVVKGDVCQITGSLVDANVYSAMTSGDLSFQLPSSATDVTAKIDGEVVTGLYHKTTGSETTWTIGGIDFETAIFGYGYEITFTSQTTTNMPYTTRVQLTGEDATNQPLGTFAGPDLNLNFTDGQIDATANPLTFGTLDGTSLGKDVGSQMVHGGNLLDVTDNRRHREQTAIQLQQTTPFQLADRTLDASLSYDSGSSWGPTPLSAVSQTILNVGEGIAIQAIGNHGEHLNLRLGYAGIHPGHYTSTLTWTFATAPGV
ncbi:Ig-like domain-containing protein [Levilactobacillus cerevisiae]|uniref:Ig-like domain-containing protein n=1 Tax=Levilactobacillus cerevisiae TaxID=1704076 RepID=UPI000F78997C|nr:hypothetical protein [Levilactobacillus cerevisiae]